MTQVSGIDYAFSPHPSISAIQAGGFHYVARYISRLPMNDHNGKNLLVGELGALLDNGIRVVVVAEEGASRMLGGRSAGVTDAKHANAVVKALDMPSIPIYFAADWDATPGQQKAINAYLDGAASVVTRARVGIYGGLHVVRRAYEAGKCTWIWQTLAWSGGQWYAHSHIRQVHNGIRVGGASCDLDLAMATDYGQWPRPRAPVARPCRTRRRVASAIGVHGRPRASPACRTSPGTPARPCPRYCATRSSTTASWTRCSTRTCATSSPGRPLSMPTSPRAPGSGCTAATS
jgi:hypothetical protein